MTATAQIVAIAGQSLGFWTVLPPLKGFADWAPADRPVRIADGEGREFHLSENRRERKIEIRALSVDQDWQSIHPGANSVAASASRDSEAIAKDLNRRFVENEDVISKIVSAHRVLAERVATRQNLRKIVAELNKHGYFIAEHVLRDCNDTIPSNALYEVTMYKPNTPRIEARADGTFRFDYPPTFNVADVSAVEALIQR